MASGSRGVKRKVKEFRGGLRMFEPFSEHSEREGLNPGNGLIPTRSVAQHTRQVWDLCDPAAILLAVELDRETDAHDAHSSTGRKRLPNNALPPTAAGGIVSAGG